MQYLDGFNLFYKKNLKFFNFVFDNLADELSKLVFKKIINFKRTGDIGYLSGFSCNLKGQYFEFSLNNVDKFIDVGGFSGETSIEFINRVPNYKKIYFFEPGFSAMESAKENLNKYNNIIYYNKGCSDKSGQAYFFENGTSSTIQTIETENIIELVALDDLILSCDNCFIKMDVEGAEYDALLGARNIIKSGKAMLAICVYHRSTDIFNIPMLILSLNPNYKVYLRHYTEGIFETVMYFIPHSNF